MAYSIEYLKIQIEQLEYQIILLTNKSLTYKKEYKPNCKLYPSEWTKLESTHPHIIYLKNVMQMGDAIHRKKNKLNHFKNLLICL